MAGGRPFCRRSRSFSRSWRSAEREWGEWGRRSLERERRCRERRVREVEREHLLLGDLESEDNDGDDDDEALWPFYFNPLILKWVARFFTWSQRGTCGRGGFL